MKNLKIGKKLLVTFGIIIALFLAAILLSVAALNRTGGQFTDFYTYTYPMSTTTMEIRRELEETIKYLSMSMLTEDEQKTAEYISQIEQEMQAAIDNLTYLLEHYRGDVSRIKEAMESLNEAKEYQAVIQELASANRNSEASEQF